MTELSISQVGLSNADSHRLKTVLVMAVIGDGSLRKSWKFVESPDANLVVTSLDSEEGRELIGSTKQVDGRRIALLAGEADEVPDGVTKLPWPIRLEELLKLLRSVEKKFGDSDASIVKSEPVTTSNEVPLIRLASLLRDSDGATSNTAWKVEGLSRNSVYVSPGEKLFYLGESLNGLRNIDPHRELSFDPVPIEDVQRKAGKKPLVMLQWLVGLQTGSFGYLPWLSEDQAIRLRRYPAFQILHHDPEHRRLASVLSRLHTDAKSVAKVSRVSPDRAYAFVNAASLCGYLVQSAKQPARAKAGRPGKKAASLFSSFRRALGIESVNA